MSNADVFHRTPSTEVVFYHGKGSDAEGNVYGAEVGPRQFVKYVMEDDEQ